MAIEDRDDPLSGADEEVRFHLEAQAADLVEQGWSEEAAAAEARRRFGNPDRVERRLHGMAKRRRRMAARSEWWNGIVRDIGFAARQVRRRPGFAAASISVLALGIGMASSVFAVVDASLLKPLPFRDPEAMVAVRDLQAGSPLPASLPEFQDWEREAGSVFRALAGYGAQARTIRLGDLPERVRVVMVLGDLQTVTGLSPIVGRYFTPEEREPPVPGASVVLLSESFWRDRMGADAGVVGRTLEVDGQALEIVGVLPAATGVAFSDPDQALWLPLPTSAATERGMHTYKVVGRLAPGLDVASARPRLETIASGIRETGVTEHSVGIEPLRDSLLGSSRRVALILAGAALLVLLVVCANLAHLFLARGWARAREFAVRGAIGAGRGVLVRQMLTESTLISLAGGLAGVGVAQLVTGWVARSAGNASVVAMASPGQMSGVAFALVVSLALGLTFGFVPARRAASADPGDALRGGTGVGTSAGRSRFRRVLVGLEVGLSVVLLTGAGLLVRSVRGLVSEETGYRTEGVLTAEIDLPAARYDTQERRIAFWDALDERLTALPGVDGAAVSTHLPLRGDTNGGFAIVGQENPNEDEGPYSKKRVVGVGFFETMQIAVLRGRTFLPSDRLGAPGVAVISQAVADEYWPGDDPIGKRIQFYWGVGQDEQEVVGVVGDVRTDGLDRAAEGTIYVPSAQVGFGSMKVVLHASGDPAVLTMPLRRAVSEMDPALSVSSVRTLDSILRNSVSDRTTVMQLLGAFAALALLLAGVGVYAVAAQSVTGRRREIGLRIAIGANPGEVAKRVLGDELRPVMVGLVAGVVASAWGGRALSGLLYEVSPSDPVTLVVVTLVLLAAAAGALALPALRAVRVDPSETLRPE